MKKLETYLHNKKLLLSLGVVAGAVILISIGVWVEGKIVDGAEQKARMYQTSIQTKSEKQFNYAIDTKQGRILAEVTVKSVDLVKFGEMNKEFAKVKKTKERYTEHERTVCETKYRTETRTRTVYDPTTETYSTETYTEEVPYEECHQETYYTWDQIDSWEKSAKKVDMMGREYPIDLFSFGMRGIDAKEIIPGETGKYVREEADVWIDLNFGDDEGDIRYGYDVLELPKSGTVFLNVSEGLQPMFGSKIDLQPSSPEQLVKNAQNDAETQKTIFRVFWGFLVILELCGLGYLVWFHENF